MALQAKAVTVLEVIQKSTAYLEKKGVASARLQSELLLAHVCKLPRLQLYLNFERNLGEPELEQMRELVRRRGAREPLQHLIGSVSFCGLELQVGRQALIPRPETELLAEKCWEYLSKLQEPAPAVLDFGTGTGCLAIAVASHCPTARVWATDISAEAIELARANAARHQLEGRIQFFCGDGFSAIPEPVLFDLIVSNPPYIPSAEIAGLEPEVRDYDPRIALDGGADGLDFYRRLAAEGMDWLKGGGRLMVELGDGQAGAVRELFEAKKWVVESVQNDYSGKARVLEASRARK